MKTVNNGENGCGVQKSSEQTSRFFVHLKLFYKIKTILKILLDNSQINFL